MFSSGWRMPHAISLTMKPVKIPFNCPHPEICAVILAIPRGRVASYGEIAARAGLPGRARLVGKVLRDAGAVIRLPWHRVLQAGGRSAFSPDSENFFEQRRRLAAEGVVMKGRRVDMRAHGWQRDLDAELWAPMDA